MLQGQGTYRDNKDVEHIRILPTSAMPWIMQLQAQKQTFSSCNGNKMLMAVAWGIWSIPASLPSSHRQPGTFADCFLQQVGDEYVHNTGKPHSPTLHSVCQEHRFCTPALKRFSIRGRGVCFWRLLWDHHSSSHTNLTWLSLGYSAEWTFKNTLCTKTLHLLSHLMALDPYLYIRITPHPLYI